MKFTTTINTDNFKEIDRLNKEAWVTNCVKEIGCDHETASKFYDVLQKNIDRQIDLALISYAAVENNLEKE